MDEREIQLDITKKYNIPNSLSRRYLPNGILIIAIDSANWVLLHNYEQEKIFNMLMTSSIEEVIAELDNPELHMDNLMHVLTELEAKQFESQKHKEQGLKNLNLYLTNRCNLRCKHCYMFAGTPLANELQTNEILTLLKEFRQYGGCNLILSGGEITERSDLREIITTANELHLKTTLLTNGTNWSDDLVEYIFDKVAEVQVSIDGYNEESNSKIRGVGQFQRALDTVKRKDCDLKYICGGGCRIAYVPSLLEADPDAVFVFQREGCTEADRMKLYEKMIAANDLFYS